MGGVDPDLSRFKEGTGYVAFGDSITRGYGIYDTYEEWLDKGNRFDNTENTGYNKTNKGVIGAFA